LNQVIGTWKVSLVDRNNIANFQDAGFDRLYAIAETWHLKQQGCPRQVCYLNLALAHTHRFNQDGIEASSIE